MRSRSACSRACLLARTLKPMMAAPAAEANVTSDSVMAPTPEWMTRAETSSLPSFSSAPTMASTEPCTSPLMTSGKTFWASALVELRLDDHALGGGRRIGPEVEQLGLQQDAFEELVEIGALQRRDLD